MKNLKNKAEDTLLENLELHDNNHNNYIQILEPIDISYNFIKTLPTETEVCTRIILDLDGKPQNNYFGRYSEYEWARFLISIKNSNGKLNEPILIRLEENDIVIEDGAHRLKAIKMLIEKGLIFEEEQKPIPVVFKISPCYNFSNLNILINSLLINNEICKNDYVKFLNQLILLRVEHKQNSKPLLEDAHRQGIRAPGMVWKTVHHNWRSWNKRLKDPDKAIRGFGKELHDYEMAKLWAMGKTREREIKQKQRKSKSKKPQPSKDFNFAALAAAERKKELKKSPALPIPKGLDRVTNDFNKIWFVADYGSLNPAFKINKNADAYIIRDKKYILKNKLKEMKLFSDLENGLKISWGLDVNSGKVLYNFGSNITSDTSDLLSNAHPMQTALKAGAAAIEQSIQKIPSNILRASGLLEGNWINGEIIFKDINSTNIIKMSNITSEDNEIKNSLKILNEMMKYIGSVAATSQVTGYEGENLKDIKHVVSLKTSNWQFETGQLSKINKSSSDNNIITQIESLISQGDNSLYKAIVNELGLKTELSKVQWEKFDNVEDFLSIKSAKFKSTRRNKGSNPNEPFNKIFIVNKIEKALDRLQELYLEKSEHTYLIKLSAHQLLILKKNIEEANTFIDLANVFAMTLNLKKR